MAALAADLRVRRTILESAGRASPMTVLGPLVFLASLLTAPLWASDKETTARTTLPRISMFAGGHFGPGWWTLAIDEKGSVTENSTKSGARRLSEPQKEAALALISALPRGRPSHRLVGPHYIDATVEFRLTIGRGVSQREYVVNDSFQDYADHPEAKEILALMHFLRALVESKAAVIPPTIEGPLPRVSPPPNNKMKLTKPATARLVRSSQLILVLGGP